MQRIWEFSWSGVKKFNSVSQDSTNSKYFLENGVNGSFEPTFGTRKGPHHGSNYFNAKHNVFI